MLLGKQNWFVRCVPAAASMFWFNYADAQTSIAIYGIADANVEYATNMSSVVPNAANGFRTGPGHSVARANSGGQSGSRWGLRGVENLGNGLRALIVLEGGFGIDTGSMQQGGRLFGRQAYVGMAAEKMGSITFGRQYTAIFDSFANFSPQGYAAQYDPLWLQLGLNARSDNTMKYVGKFSGFTATAHWSLGNGVAGNGELPGQFRRDKGYGAAVRYTSGLFGAALVYDQYNPTLNATTGATGSNRKAGAAASYVVGPAKIMGGYRWGKNEGAASQTISRDDYYWVGVNYQISPITLTLAYYYDDWKNFNGANPKNPWQISFAANYVFSKRTDLYLTTAFARNAGLALDTQLINNVNGYYLGSDKTSMVGVALGIRHRF